MIGSKTKEAWFLFKDIARSPFLNMAIDQVLLNKSTDIGWPLLRFYSWDRPSVSIGYIQKYNAVNKAGYTIVRRPTGGGIVFHDQDLTYTIIFPKSHWIAKLDRSESYYAIHKVIINALNSLGMITEMVFSGLRPTDRMAMRCFSTPARYDIKLKDSLGADQKIAGAAQRRTKSGILHQGTIIVDDINGKRNLLINALLNSFKRDFDLDFKDYQMDENLLHEAKILVDTQYGLDCWNKLR